MEGPRGPRRFLAVRQGTPSAGLNFGNCFSYALAKAPGEPLLFKGDDFQQDGLDFRQTVFVALSHRAEFSLPQLFFGKPLERKSPQ
jgi:hypothetical protein